MNDGVVKTRSRQVLEQKVIDSLIVKGTAEDIKEFADGKFVRPTLDLSKFMGVSCIQLGKTKTPDRKTNSIFCSVHTFNEPFDIAKPLAYFGYEHDIRDIPPHRKLYESYMLRLCFCLYCGDTLDNYIFDLLKSNVRGAARMDYDQATDIESLAFVKSVESVELTINAKKPRTYKKCSKWNESLIRFGLSRLLELEEQIHEIRERNFQAMMTGLRSIK